ncbi:MAG: spermidine synthase [Verrucomicrobiia bacterium]
MMYKLLTACLLYLTLLSRVAGGEIVFEATSRYHNIRVVDEAGFRFLSFDGSTETRMSLANPLSGHFEYTEYFHLVWLWNDKLTNVLMVGLGGGSAQKLFQYYYPKLKIETVEIDPAVVNIAEKFFYFKRGENQIVHINDGRQFLNRTTNLYGAIIMDAYHSSRYGSFVPYHLTTREFFQIALSRLTTNGVIAYNVIGTINGFQSDIVAAVYKTMKSVFPQVYIFPARESMNVVLIGTRSNIKATKESLRAKANLLLRQNRVSFPLLTQKVEAFYPVPPPIFEQAQILTDDYAPVDDLLRTGER